MALDWDAVAGLPDPAIRYLRSWDAVRAELPHFAREADGLAADAAQRAQLRDLVLRLLQTCRVAEAARELAFAQALVRHAPAGERARWHAVVAHLLASTCPRCDGPWPVARVEAEQALPADHALARAGAWDPAAVEAFLQALGQALVAHGYLGGGTSTRPDGVVLHARLTLPEPAAWAALVQQARAIGG